MSPPPAAKSAEQVFEAYGRVMAKIGALEQFLRISLAEHEVDRRVAAGTPFDTEAFARRVLRMDFGGLVQQVCDRFKLSPELRAVLKQAKGFRNHLAHEFWASQFHNMQTERGRSITFRDCALYDKQFDRVADLVITVTGVDAASYAAFVRGTADQPEVFKEWEARLEQVEKTMRDWSDASAAASSSTSPAPQGS